LATARTRHCRPLASETRALSYTTQDYPQKPPKVQFLTTGGGTVRFNPNLYESGRVCLSLLGTWDGPSWDPGTSTLLQVGSWWLEVPPHRLCRLF
jgi:hypothetical protein